MSYLFHLCSLQPEHAGHWEVSFLLPRDLARQDPRAPVWDGVWHLLDVVLTRPFALPGLAQGWLHTHHCSCTACRCVRSTGRRTGAWLHAAQPAQPGEVREGSPGCEDGEGGCCDHVDPAGHLRSGFISPAWMNSAPGQLPLLAGPSDNDSEWPSQ